MPRLFVGNFDFEHTLAGRTGTARIGSISASMASAWIPVSGPDDLILCSDVVQTPDLDVISAWRGRVPRCVAPDGPIPTGLELVPWGCTPAMRELAARWSLSYRPPPDETVSRVNARRFRLELEHELGVNLPGTRLVSGLAEADAAVRDLPSESLGWVFKSEYGMAGRERIIGRKQLTVADRGWLTRRLARFGSVVFEPWVERLSEAGLQFELTERGPPSLVGVSELLAGPRGEYVGSRIHRDQAQLVSWQPAIDCALVAAERIQQAGYFGPLGIDAMWYRDAAGEPALRPLQDINARHTMGRLCLGFLDSLQAGEIASWWQVGAAALSQVSLADLAERVPRVRWLSTTFEAVAQPATTTAHGPMARASVLIVAPDRDLLLSAERQLAAELGWR